MPRTPRRYYMLSQPGTSWSRFETRRSVVQIHSPRLSKHMLDNRFGCRACWFRRKYRSLRRHLTTRGRCVCGGRWGCLARCVFPLNGFPHGDSPRFHDRTRLLLHHRRPARRVGGLWSVVDRARADRWMPRVAGSGHLGAAALRARGRVRIHYGGGRVVPDLQSLGEAHAQSGSGAGALARGTLETRGARVQDHRRPAYSPKQKNRTY
jgi:hypothetical protein